MIPLFDAAADETSSRPKSYEAQAITVAEVRVDPSYVKASPRKVTLDDDLAGGSDESKVMIPIPLHAWSNSLEREFTDLAAAEALGGIDARGLARLKGLQVQRRNLKHPRSGEEIMLEYRQREATKKLLDALQEYVQLHSGPRGAWAHAQENFHEFDVP